LKNCKCWKFATEKIGYGIRENVEYET